MGDAIDDVCDGGDDGDAGWTASPEVSISGCTGVCTGRPSPELGGPKARPRLGTGEDLCGLADNNAFAGVGDVGGDDDADLTISVEVSGCDRNGVSAGWPSLELDVPEANG